MAPSQHQYAGKTQYCSYAETNFATWEEVETGEQFGPLEVTITEELLDLWLSYGDQWFEPYAIGWAPENRRILPTVITLMAYPHASHPSFPYRFRGMAAGLRTASIEPMYAGEKYLYYVTIGEKFEKRGRQYVWVNGHATDESGRLMSRCDYLQVCSGLSLAEDLQDLPPLPDLDTTTLQELEEFPYTAPPEWRREDSVTPKDWPRGAWERVDGVYPDPSPGYVDATWDVGRELVPESTKFTWRRSRDAYAYYNRMLWYAPRVPGDTKELDEKYAAFNVHTNSRAAAAWGSVFANVVGEHLLAQVSNAMYRAFGAGWVTGGEMSCKFVFPGANLDDFFTVRGRIVSKTPEGDAVRVGFEVTGENQRGEVVLAGTASGLIPAGT